jgi:hypothetical protein
MNAGEAISLTSKSLEKEQSHTVLHRTVERNRKKEKSRYVA